MFYDKYLQELHDVANKSPIKYSIASVLFHNKKITNTLSHNTDRSLFHGAICSSLHAETNSILKYFGNNIQYDRHKQKWILKGKERQIRYFSYKKLQQK
jgi:deoxycytidylate deaminase